MYNTCIVIVANEKIRHLRYEPLRRRLNEIPYWPHRYLHKVIGKSGEPFEKSITQLEGKFPNMKRTQFGKSRNGTYISVTFELQADHVDEIISLWLASEEIEDCVKIL